MARACCRTSGWQSPLASIQKHSEARTTSIRCTLRQEIGPGKRTYGTLTDVYAFGMTLYRMVNGDGFLTTIAPAIARQLAKSGLFPDRKGYREFVPRPLRTIINKALAVNPAQRFQSADEMRHALEKLTLEMNWSERLLRNGVEWSCGWNNRCVRIRRRRLPGGKAEVIVHRGRSKQHLRRVSPLCRSGISETEAFRYSQRLLQDLVMGKKVKWT